MKKVYKAHILYTKEQSRFEVLENGYVAVDANVLCTTCGSSAPCGPACSLLVIPKAPVC